MPVGLQSVSDHVPVTDDCRELPQRLNWSGCPHYRGVIPPSITSSLLLMKAIELVLRHRATSRNRIGMVREDLVIHSLSTVRGKIATARIPSAA